MSCNFAGRFYTVYSPFKDLRLEYVHVSQIPDREAGDIKDHKAHRIRSAKKICRAISSGRPRHSIPSIWGEGRPPFAKGQAERRITWGGAQQDGTW
jgi:hypothetical protein